MADKELTGRVQRTDDFPDAVVPTRLRRLEFDTRRGLDIQFGPIRWSAIPSVGGLGNEEKALDVRRVVDNPSTWLILRRDSLDIVAGLELEVTASGKEGRVDVRVLRSSGRSVAEGSAWSSGSGIEFEVRVLGVRVPRRKKGRTALKGTLDGSGRLRMRVASPSSGTG